MTEKAKRYKGEKYDFMSPKTRKILVDHFRPHSLQFFQMVNRTFPWQLYWNQNVTDTRPPDTNQITLKKQIGNVVQKNSNQFPLAKVNNKEKLQQTYPNKLNFSNQTKLNEVHQDTRYNMQKQQRQLPLVVNKEKTVKEVPRTNTPDQSFARKAAAMYLKGTHPSRQDKWSRNPPRKQRSKKGTEG